MPMSLPTITTPAPPDPCSSPMSRCFWVNACLTWLLAATTETILSTSGLRMDQVTSNSPIWIVAWRPSGSSLLGALTPIGNSSAIRPTASLSVLLIPLSCIAQATARYMTPVSKKRKPRLWPTRKPTVLLPDAAGPSIAIAFTALT